MSRLMHHRKAVRVLPLPVGERIRVDSPRAMAGQPRLWGGVGVANEARNHSATAGWKSSSTSVRFATIPSYRPVPIAVWRRPRAELSPLHIHLLTSAFNI